MLTFDFFISHWRLLRLFTFCLLILKRWIYWLFTSFFLNILDFFLPANMWLTTFRFLIQRQIASSMTFLALTLIIDNNVAILTLPILLLRWFSTSNLFINPAWFFTFHLILFDFIILLRSYWLWFLWFTLWVMTFTWWLDFWFMETINSIYFYIIIFWNWGIFQIWVSCIAFLFFRTWTFLIWSSERLSTIWWSFLNQFYLFLWLLCLLPWPALYCINFCFLLFNVRLLSVRYSWFSWRMMTFRTFLNFSWSDNRVVQLSLILLNFNIVFDRLLDSTFMITFFLATTSNWSTTWSFWFFYLSCRY